jgi:hypothetical protein
MIPPPLTSLVDDQGEVSSDDCNMPLSTHVAASKCERLNESIIELINYLYQWSQKLLSLRAPSPHNLHAVRR